LIAHEAGHAHDQTVIDRQLPGWLLREPVNDYETAPALAALDEYTACRLSATFGDERETKNYEATFVKVLSITRQQGNQIILKYRTSGNNLTPIISEFIPLYGRLMKAYSYLLGHIDGLNQRLEEAAPAAHEAIQTAKWFSELAKRWHESLQQGWELYGAWKSPEDLYMAQKEIFHDVLKAAGIDIQPYPHSVQSGNPPCQCLGFFRTVLTHPQKPPVLMGESERAVNTLWRRYTDEHDSNNSRPIGPDRRGKAAVTSRSLWQSSLAFPLS
jgi:hypothetical protein